MTATIPVTAIEQMRAHQINSLDELYAVNGEPHEMIINKFTTYLTPLCEEFIAKSPFFMIATADGEGLCDVSPKGDPPGAVRVLDPHTLIIPDRPGNRRVDGHKNILVNPHIALIFVVPNVEETLRVNGRAWLTSDPEILATMQVQGKTPKLATVVEVEEVFMHCARSFLRGGMWKPETWPDPDTVPTIAAIYHEQKELPPPDESNGKRQEEYRKVLY